MKNLIRRGLTATALLLVGGMLWIPAARAASSEEARVTRVIREVNLLPSQAQPRPAVLNDKVRDGTGVRTGNSSRSELTFPDLTIERLGSNTIFSFNRGGRNVQLDSGSVLLRVPKDSGGASMSTTAVTVGVTGTTLILETRKGRNILTVLEGGTRLSLNKNRKESVFVHGGQKEDVPPGATTLPPPVNVNLSDIMKNNPLITDFGPLPSRDLIMATASNPPVYQGQPVDSGPTSTGPGFVPIIPTIIGVGVGSGHGYGGGPHRNPHTKSPVKGQTTTPKTGTPKTGAGPNGTNTIGSNATSGNPGKQNTGPRKKRTPAPSKTP